MSNAAQDSQQKSGNLKVYAFEVSRINAATVSLKLRLLGGVSSVRTIAVSELPNCISQIEQALADAADEVEINVGSGVCAISPKLLKNLKTSLSSYNAVSGGSDANVVREGVSTPIKPKASALQGNASAARQNLISQKDTCANSDVELDNSAHTAQVSADFVNQVAQIVGKELRKAVMPLLAEIDAIAALLNECALEVAASKPVHKRNAGKSSTDGTPISIRRGRTSLVVGSRKVS